MVLVIALLAHVLSMFACGVVLKMGFHMVFVILRA